MTEEMRKRIEEMADAFNDFKKGKDQSNEGE